MKTTKTIISVIAAIAMAACGGTRQSSQADNAAAMEPVGPAFSADSAYRFCEAQCAFGPRIMNSEAHERCGEWIAQRFRDYGCTVELQQADLRGYDGTLLKSTNIIARQQSAADNSKPRLLLCAHWDSRPWADNDADENNWRKPVMGANDGASGVAVMLEVARVLQQNDSAGMAVDFICFDAEDWGIPQWKGESAEDSWALGAQYWAEHMQGQEANYQFGILLDMVGGQGARFFREGFSMRHARPIVEKILALDTNRRALQTESDALLSQQKQYAARIGGLMKEGEREEAEAVKKEVAALKARSGELLATA